MIAKLVCSTEAFSLKIFEMVLTGMINSLSNCQVIAILDTVHTSYYAYLRDKRSIHTVYGSTLIQ